ncbi:MAG TPA: hypothetical protein ENJ53_00490 [Phaeodactylibacter sp.]|nr:hypothetical protein [Phaeodactylibacter sp.]
MQLNCNNPMLIINGSTTDSSATLIYEWTTTDGNIVSGANTLNPQISSEGTYELMISNTATGCSATDQVVITENFETPTADAGTTDELNCTQAFATLNGSGSSMGNNFIYQ